jgi:hypothetical protein
MELREKGEGDVGSARPFATLDAPKLALAFARPVAFADRCREVA